MAAQGPTPAPSPPRSRRGTVSPNRERPRVPYPCWGLPRGAAWRPPLLLRLLARPLRRQEAGPPLGSSPAELRRGKKAPPSARGVPWPVPSTPPVRNRRRPLLTRGSWSTLPRPPSRRLPHPRSLPPRGGTCRFVVAAGSNPERQPSPGARPPPLPRRLQSSNATPETEVETGTEAGKVPGAGPGGGKSRENPRSSLPRPRRVPAHRLPPAAARCGDVMARGRSPPASRCAERMGEPCGTAATSPPP